MNRNAPPLALLLAIAAGLTACASDGPWVELKGTRFFVEVADDDAERARGLMFRDQLGADRGMLFLHERDEPQAYWMKNTKIPLDILYFDAQKKLVSAQKGVPPCSGGNRCPPYPSEGAVRYVLELNAGTADKLGVAKGDVLVFAPEITVPPGAQAPVAQP
jgi:uncharacterized membrane protein (UPF0127 family)